VNHLLQRRIETMERASADLETALRTLLAGEDRRQALGILADLTRTAAKKAVAEAQPKQKPISG
jgi:hypothetical protein